MRKWHLDIGDSSDGPIGACGVVEAPDKAAALARFREVLEMLSTYQLRRPNRANELGVEYLNVYFNPDAIEEWMIEEEIYG